MHGVCQLDLATEKAINTTLYVSMAAVLPAPPRVSMPNCCAVWVYFVRNVDVCQSGFCLDAATLGKLPAKAKRQVGSRSRTAQQSAQIEQQGFDWLSVFI